MFQGLSERELDSIRTHLVEKSFGKGERLFSEGNLCGRIFIVCSGQVKLYRTSPQGREQILETLGPGDTCACNPGALEWSCASTAEAISPCTVWLLSREQYAHMVETNPKVSHALNQLFADRLQCFSVLIEEVSLKDSRKRLIKFLLDMPAPKSNDSADLETLFIPFTREEIAQRIGTARETVERQLAWLVRAKLIEIKPRQITILDRPGLEKLL